VFFSLPIKAYALAIALVQWGKVFPKKHDEELSMRANRVLVADGWYWVSTDINNREGVFWSRKTVRLLRKVLREARGVYEFEIRGLRVEANRVSFYIKAANGFMLPAIMQWIKQTFAVRYNVGHGRTGHIWGERYWSVVLGCDPPESAEVYDLMADDWVEGAEAAADGGGGEATGMTALDRVQSEGSHHAAERAKNPHVPPVAPGCTAQPKA
jgi:REP element-mobilizing transposase RayT